ncbi:hypothetical protein RHGRI_025351 [Rhododendron griersonianum]|uniref:Uncharacterized protein n=1 Tax=Rhododendron griersonianum TaxID=479676 RepID=A0AAV6INZ0_9ERIC|nr:hypothetical protein RHGRI_025351 [Rhododendron griersonianum]
MVDAVVSFVVDRLGDLLIEQVVFLRGVEDDVKWLRDKLEYMLCFMKDAEEKQDDVDNRMRKWISDIRDVAYEAEDIIDNFILKVEAETPKKMGLKDCFQKYFCICGKRASLIQQANLYGIGQEINTLKTKLTQIQQNQVTFGIRSIDDARERSNRINTEDSWLRRERPYKDDEHVVGFKEDVDKLMSQLVKKVKDRYVISIVGTGGLGKTTIARKLYNTPSLTEEFDCYAWVSVSTDYKIQDLLRSTIKSFKKPNTKEELEFLEKMKEEDLERHLRDYLKGHRYLVVLDDVWDVNAWRSLSGAFPDEKNGSRVIMTTRNKVVAEPSDERTYVHELPFLKDGESLELFCSKAFPHYDEVGNQKSRCPPGLESLAKEMASKCHGLPLAIVVLDMRLRTLLFFNLANEDPEIAQLQSLCRQLRLLRVLDLDDDRSIAALQEQNKRLRLPDEIGKLIHLRYLGLTNIYALSQFIGNLHALQTLELNTIGAPIQLPDEICKAKQLRHLIGRFKWPFRVDNMKNLQTLKRVVVEGQMEFNPMDLINLRELSIQYVGEGENRNTLDCIGGLTNLETLELDSLEASQSSEVDLQTLCRCQHLLQLRLASWGRGAMTHWKLPTEVLPNLRYLQLYVRVLSEDPMPVLEKLPKLTILLLDSLSANMVCTAGGFPQLEILQLCHFASHSASIQVEEGGMPVLKGLLIDSIGGGDVWMPDRLRSIPRPDPPLEGFEWAY